MSREEGDLPRRRRRRRGAGQRCLQRRGRATAQGKPKAQRWTSNGAVHGPAYTVPWSSLASTEGKAFFIEMSKATVSARRAEVPTSRPCARRVDDAIFKPQIEQQKAAYPVKIEQQTIAGVYTEVFTPVGGVPIANAEARAHQSAWRRIRHGRAHGGTDRVHSRSRAWARSKSSAWTTARARKTSFPRRARTWPRSIWSCSRLISRATSASMAARRAEC